MTAPDERDALRAQIEALTAELAAAREKLARLEARSDRAPATPAKPALPSGPWRGFYTYAGQTWRHPTRLEMTFSGMRIEGTGDDIVGAFTISGTIDPTTGACRWTKQYRGKHPVEYTATRVANTLTGHWQIPNTPGGAFALWPGDTDEMPAVLEKEVAKWR